MSSMDTLSDERVEGRYVLIKRGLYWRPNAQGYTGLKSEAGIYSATAYDYAEDDEHNATRRMRFDDAPEIAPGASDEARGRCWPRARRGQGVLRRNVRPHAGSAEAHPCHPPHPGVEMNKVDDAAKRDLGIGQRAAELRALRGLSLQNVADRAGMTKSWLWEIEQGRQKNPTINSAIALSRALGVSLDYLTGLSPSKPDLHPEALRIAIEVDALLRGGTN